MVLIGCVNPILLIPGGVLGIIFFYLRTYYLNTARSVKRLEGIGKSDQHVIVIRIDNSIILVYGFQFEVLFSHI